MMKVSFLLLPLIMLCHEAGAQSTAMTYNIRYSTPNDKDNWWEHRKGEVAQLLEHYSPDFFGLQEGLHGQITYLDSSLVAYDYVGVGRDDGATKGEYTAIFYRTDRLRLLNTDTYWLSERPDTVSVGWDASMERIVTYAHLQDVLDGNTFHVFNAHFDHIGPKARANSATLILEIIKQKNIEAERIVVMGDLNCTPDDLPLQRLAAYLSDSYASGTTPPYGPVGTFNGFATDWVPDNRRIDYILTRNAKVRTYVAIDDRRKNGLWPSDHLPVMVSFK